MKSYKTKCIKDCINLESAFKEVHSHSCNLTVSLYVHAARNRMQLECCFPLLEQTSQRSIFPSKEKAYFKTVKKAYFKTDRESLLQDSTVNLIII